MSLLPGAIGTATSAAAGLSRSLVAARSANPTTPTLPASGLPRAAAQPKDELSISPGAKTAANDVAAAAQDGRNIGGQVSVDEIRAEHQQNIAELDTRLKQLFREHGISAEPVIRLKTEANGQIVVEGDHPQKQAIEQLLNQQTELRQLFNQVSSDAGFLQAADIANDFQRRFAEQPVEAIAWLQQIAGAGKTPDVSVLVDNDKLAVEVA